MSKASQFIAVCHRTLEYLRAQSRRRRTCLGEGTAQPWLPLRGESLGGRCPSPWLLLWGSQQRSPEHRNSHGGSGGDGRGSWLPSRTHTRHSPGCSRCPADLTFLTPKEGIDENMRDRASGGNSTDWAGVRPLGTLARP